MNSVMVSFPASYARIRQPLFRIGLLCAAWCGLGLLGYGRHYLQEIGSASATPFWAGSLSWLICYLAWVPLTPFVFRLERRFSVEPPRLFSNIIVLAAAGFTFGYSAYLLTQALSIFVTGFGLGMNSHLSWIMPWSELCIEFTMFFLVVIAASAIRRFRELEARRHDAAQFEIERANIEAALRKAELETLRMRINPHFLFNALQNISVLAQQDARTAGKMLTRLGDVLRTAISPEFQAQVPLGREIELTRAYLELEKMRFGDRLAYEITLERGTESIRVPSLLLQPLVENAIVHGLSGVQRSGRIEVRSYRDGALLILSVADNGAGFQRNAFGLRSGVGLGSTHERLKRMYPEQEQPITIANRSEGGTEIRIRIPKVVSPAAQTYDPHPSAVCG